jgi:DNA-directed RNA polymerase specialized sigma24 family protein
MSLLADAIPQVAARRLKFLPVPSREDLEAELWLAACEQAQVVNELASDGQGAAVEMLLAKAGRRVQQAEEREYRARRAYALGFEPTDEAFYSLGLLRVLVPAYLDGGVSEQPPRKRDESGPVRPGGSGEYGDWEVMMLDMQAGLARLPAWQRSLLERYFSYPQGSGGWTHLEIASAMGVESEALRHRVTRALGALQSVLGGPML